MLAARRAAVVAAISALFAFLAAGGGASPASVEQLRARDVSLQARTRAATLELYALQSQLAQARARLAGVRAQRERAEEQLASLRVQLDVAWRSLYVSEERLGSRLRQLYEHGQTDPIAILLGAETLEEAVTGLEGLRSLASGDRDIVEQVRQARAELKRTQGRIAARATALRVAELSAAATTEHLAATQAERRGYLVRLAVERGFTARRIARLRTVVRAATKRTNDAPATPVTATPVAVIAEQAPTAPVAAAPAAAAGARDSLTVVSTGYSIQGRTATGLPTGWGVVAVDPNVIPLGTRLTIPGYGEGIAADTGGAVQGNMIDLWFPTRAQALAWGRRTVTIGLQSG